MKKIRLGIAALLSAAAGISPVHAKTMFLGGYPDEIMVLDDQTGAITQKIKLDAGLPVSMTLSDDNKLLYITTITSSGIAVIDVATKKVINSFQLDTPSTRYRFSGGVPDSTGRYFYIVAERIDKLNDRYRIHDQAFMVVDLQQKKIVREVPVSSDDDVPAYRTRLMLSPDNKKLYVVGKKVLVLDTATLKTIDTLDPGEDLPEMTDVEFGRGIDRIVEPGQFVAPYTAEDKFIHNKIFGIGRFDLASQQFTFDPIGHAADTIAGVQVSPDGKKAYLVAENGKYGNQTCEFQAFDVATHLMTNQASFPCRRRFYFSMSADGSKLYIYGAGYDVAVYDAATLQPLADWQLSDDTTMSGMVIPQ